MTLVIHELKQRKLSLFIWTVIISFLMSVFIFLFPEMKGEMEDISDLFSSLGPLTAAFGMDRLNYGTFIGYYAIECGNVLGLGGAFYAALCAVGVLSKEEKEKTAEFLLTHPVSRTRIVTEKLLSVVMGITAMNLIVSFVSVGSIGIVGEPIPWKELCLLHLAYYLLQLQLAGICFGLSAFLRRGSMGAGLGLAALLYFLNLVANITGSMKFLKYITPFGYCDGADIVAGGHLNAVYLAIGMTLCVAGVTAAYLKYIRKDIH